MDEKLVIGIIGEERVQGLKKLIIFNDRVSDMIVKNDSLPLGILPTNINASKELNTNEINSLHEMIDMCDGIILQGGFRIYPYHYEAIRYIKDKDIPVLGICLGMQIMALSSNGVKKRFTNSFHNQVGKYIHPIIIDEKSKLYGIIDRKEIVVNSSHVCYIESVDGYHVSAKDKDTIEAIELPEKLFHIGVQWHPERLYDIDENAQKLVKSFFEACRKYKSNKQ